MTMFCDVIGSGSKGNAAVLNRDILIDCGVPFSWLRGHINGVRFVLLTHIHGDHFMGRTIKRITELRPSVRFVCPPWLYEPLQRSCVSDGVIDVAQMGEGVKYAFKGTEYEFVPSHVLHDVHNCAWHIRVGEERAFYATDCVDLDGISAPGYDLYMIEANYTEPGLEERILKKQERGGYIYEDRVRQTHMSKETADKWLAQNAVKWKSKVIYMHQHDPTAGE